MTKKNFFVSFSFLESIFGIGDSASSQTLSKSSILGTESKNANIFFSSANCDFSFTPYVPDTVSIPSKLSVESQRNGIDQPDVVKNTLNIELQSIRYVKQKKFFELSLRRAK